MHILPYGTHILVQLETVSTKLIFNSSQKDYQQGLIVKLGEGFRDPRTGQRNPLPLALGHIALFKRGSGVPITSPEGLYVLLGEEDILGTSPANLGV